MLRKGVWLGSVSSLVVLYVNSYKQTLNRSNSNPTPRPNSRHSSTSVYYLSSSISPVT